jgi:hypothetical protein
LKLSRLLHRGIPLLVALMLIVVLASWLGIAGSIVKEGEQNGLYRLLLNWQTLIGAMIALAAAVVAVRPVWRQVEEMRKPQTFEHLRSRSIAIEQERALASEAMLQARSIDVIVEGLRSVDQQQLLDAWINMLSERKAALEALDADFRRAGLEKWGSLEALLRRGELNLAISGLQVALSDIIIEVHKARSSDMLRWSRDHQPRLKKMEVPSARYELEEKAWAFRAHADDECVRLGRLMNRLKIDLEV